MTVVLALHCAGHPGGRLPDHRPRPRPELPRRSDALSEDDVNRARERVRRWSELERPARPLAPGLRSAEGGTTPGLVRWPIVMPQTQMR
jgi:hypothetical protein